MKLSKGFLFIIFLIFAVGCSTVNFSKEQHFFNLISNNNIKAIELHRQGPNPVKTTSKSNDTEELFNIFETVHYKKSSNQDDVNGWSYFIIFYYEDGTKSTVSFVSKRIKYNDTWYDLDKDIRDRIGDYYNTL